MAEVHMLLDLAEFLSFHSIYATRLRYEIQKQ